VFVLLVLLIVDMENVLACWYEVVNLIKGHVFKPL